MSPLGLAAVQSLLNPLQEMGKDKASPKLSLMHHCWCHDSRSPCTRQLSRPYLPSRPVVAEPPSRKWKATSIFRAARTWSSGETCAPRDWP